MTFSCSSRRRFLFSMFPGTSAATSLRSPDSYDAMGSRNQFAILQSHVRSAWSATFAPCSGPHEVVWWGGSHPYHGASVE
jgi:hypothetical protein